MIRDMCEGVARGIDIIWLIIISYRLLSPPITSWGTQSERRVFSFDSLPIALLLRLRGLYSLHYTPLASVISTAIKFEFPETR